MKRENAEKIAAAEAGVDLGESRAVIGAFLKSLAVCPVCEGSRKFTYRTAVDVPIKEAKESQLARVDVGKDGSCALCAPHGKGDPHWVFWLCRAGGKCAPSDGEQPQGHENCGWVVALPWE